MPPWLADEGVTGRHPYAPGLTQGSLPELDRFEIQLLTKRLLQRWLWL